MQIASAQETDERNLGMAEGHQCRPDSVAICNMKNDVTWAGQKDNIVCPAVGVCMHVGGCFR